MIEVVKLKGTYFDRNSRNEFIGKTFHQVLKGNVLNISGGGSKHLQGFISCQKYVETDIAGNPDIFLDLDNTFPLPFDDNSFDCIVCTDVLEHLDKLHQVFEELIRISKNHLIISVPNATTEFKFWLRRIKYSGNDGLAGENIGMFAKYYGLPLNAPEDRHRWFFSYTEAKYFFRGSGRKLNYRVISEYPTGAYAKTFKGKLARFFANIFLSKSQYEDLFYPTYWCLIEKKNVE